MPGWVAAGLVFLLSRGRGFAGAADFISRGHPLACEPARLLMKRNARRQQGKVSLELFEEAFHLVRSAPSVALASYYLGTLPFVLGLLWFWTDMSRSPF